MTHVMNTWLEGYREEIHQAEQILGKALGYPYLDHTACPDCRPDTGCTCGNPQVCVGEHTLVSLAMEAAKLIEEVRMVPKKMCQDDNTW